VEAPAHGGLNNKGARANVRARVRRGVVGVEVEQPSIPGIVPVTADHKNVPAGVGVHVGKKSGALCAEVPKFAPPGYDTAPPGRNAEIVRK